VAHAQLARSGFRRAARRVELAPERCSARFFGTFAVENLAKMPRNDNTSSHKWHFPKPIEKESSTMAATAKPASKSEIITNIADSTQLSRKQVKSVFDALSDQIKGAVGKKGPGVFAVPGLMKITVIQKPATKARKGINPFTKEEQMFKAKPARKVIKVRPLKALKDMAK
jgi:nucleoid DNA-binding protein